MKKFFRSVRKLTWTLMVAFTLAFHLMYTKEFQSKEETPIEIREDEEE